ncbi:unnamed protein product [Gordionus sp. m RMFG-2023]|uniref:lysophospholipid acyltransferase 2-like isoform X2 n=1 Tax=Gordionus sp. m RMFG-2023 TaxID=3053472 RepID=UPI0030E2C615
MSELSVPNYRGFKYLEPLSDIVNLPIDQLNFVVTQLLGLILAYILRKKLNPLKTSYNVRMAYCLIIGFVFLYYCFGNDCLHVVILCSISYIFIYLSPKVERFHIFLSIFVFIYLSFIHFSRMTEKYHTYTLDITGPLMVMTQKLTNLAFSLHDGTCKLKYQQTPLIKKRAINRIPNILEYLSYCFHFQTLLTGPLCFYNDYIEFINGKNFTKHIKNEVTSTTSELIRKSQNGSLKSDQNNDNNDQLDDKCTKNRYAHSDNANISKCNNNYTIESIYQISALKPCLTKFMTALALAYTLVIVRPLFPIELNHNYSFIHNYSLFDRTVYLWISNAMQRIKYYFAWTCADLVSNVSGLGFNGFVESSESNTNDEAITTNVRGKNKDPDNVPTSSTIGIRGTPRWDLISNIDIIGFETSISLHSALNNWNLSTMAWLRHLVYERVSYQRTLCVYLVSAMWHGFWPGYYITFVSGAIFTEAAKMNRRKYRKYFVSNKYIKWFYDVLTFFLTRIAIAYLSIPFVLLKHGPSLIVYSSMYYWPHVLAIISVLTFYIKPPKGKD